MFAAVFVVCNLLNNQCQAVAPEVVLKDKEMCEMVAEVTRQQAISELPKTAIVMYECVEFPEAL